MVQIDHKSDGSTTLPKHLPPLSDLSTSNLATFPDHAKAPRHLHQVLYLISVAVFETNSRDFGLATLRPRGIPTQSTKQTKMRRSMKRKPWETRSLYIKSMFRILPVRISPSLEFADETLEGRSLQSPSHNDLLLPLMTSSPSAHSGEDPWIARVTKTLRRGRRNSNRRGQTRQPLLDR